MKKLVVLITAMGILLFTSCNTKNEGEMSDAAKKNLAASKAIGECFETKDFSKLGDYMAEDFIDHAGENGDVKGLANVKAEFERMVADYSDMKSEVVKALADDEYVMSWMRFTGTVTKDAMGMKAGDKFDTKALEVSKFKDGKAIEHWTFMEPSEMMKMMGGVPPPPPMEEKPATDNMSN